MNILYPSLLWIVYIALGIVLSWFVAGIVGLVLLYTAVFVYAKPGDFFPSVREHLGDLEFNKSALSLGPITLIVGLVFLGVFLYGKYNQWTNPA